MQVINKKTGEDLTSKVIKQLERELEARKLQQKIANDYELSVFIQNLANKNGFTNY
jgi:hypothetical protein